MANTENQILYGVGRSILKDFTDTSKILALSKLKDISMEMSANSEKITAGDNPYPWADMPKDKAIKISANSASFSLKMFNTTQGATITTGTTTLSDVLSIKIPADGVVNLSQTPLDNSIIVEGYALDAVGGSGKFTQDEIDKKKLTFPVADAGKDIDITFDFTSSANAQTASGTKEALAKPFEFKHIIDVYDNNNNKVAIAMLIIYKCKANNAFTFNFAQQTAFAPKIEFEAQDPERPDGKLWDFIVDPIPAT